MDAFCNTDENLKRTRKKFTDFDLTNEFWVPIKVNEESGYV
jgi:hypothetical protein